MARNASSGLLLHMCSAWSSIHSCCVAANQCLACEEDETGKSILFRVDLGHRELCYPMGGHVLSHEHGGIAAC